MSVVEHRDRQGESNDVGMGMVTHSLLAMAAQRPEYRSAVQALWAERRIDVAAATPNALWDEIRAGLITVGIPATIAKIERDAVTAVTCCPTEQQPHMMRIVQLFLRRLERIAPHSQRAGSRDVLGAIIEKTALRRVHSSPR